MLDLKDSVFRKLAQKLGFPDDDALAKLEELRGDRSLFRAACDESVLDERQVDKIRSIAKKIVAKKKAKKRAKRREEREIAEASAVTQRAARPPSGTLTLEKPKTVARRKSPRPDAAPARKPSRAKLAIAAGAAVAVVAGGAYFALSGGSKKPAAPVVAPPIAAPVAPAAPAPATIALPVAEKPITVDGWKVRVAKSGLVKIDLATLPERDASELRKGGTLTVTSNGKAVPYHLDDAALVFRAEADPTCLDERGRCYHLRVANSEKAPDASDVVAIVPDERRKYDQLPAYDLATVSSGAKSGGYWFHEAKVTFTLSAAPEKDATLALSGIFTRQGRPRGDDMQRLAGLKKRDPGTVTVTLAGKKLGEVELGKKTPEGDDAVLTIAAKDLVAGANAIELASDAGAVLVQRAELRCALPAPAATPEAIAPAAIETCKKSDLRTTDGAEWIAIAPRALVSSIEPLAAHRAKTLASKVVALEDVEDAFADGAFGPDGIRAFLDFARASWKTKPRFVLLVGDALHDARPNVPWAILPTALVDSFENGATASDNALAPAGVAVGRFPARTPEEASALVAKTIAYETSPADGAWRKQLAFVCGEGHFGRGADAMIEDLFTRAVSSRVPDPFDIDVTYANPTSVYFYPPDDFSKGVTDRLSRGALIVNYVGHGGPTSFDHVYWGTKSFPIFGREDAAKVACEPGRNPIVLITACLTGAFDEAERSVGEELVLNPKGAVAVFAASRESSPITNALLSLELTSRLFKDAGDLEPAKRPRLGERLRGAVDGLSIESAGDEGKAVLAFVHMAGGKDELVEQLVRDARSVYNLLGDPALAIPYARAAKLEAPDSAAAGSTIEVKVDGVDLDRVTLERRRESNRTMKGLPEGTGPGALADADVKKKIVDTHDKANDLVAAEAKIESGKAKLTIPKDLKFGEYVLKAWSSKSGGAAAAVRIQVEDADDDEKKEDKGG